MKKILSIVCALALALSLMSATAFLAALSNLR